MQAKRRRSPSSSLAQCRQHCAASNRPVAAKPPAARPVCRKNNIRFVTLRRSVYFLPVFSHNWNREDRLGLGGGRPAQQLHTRTRAPLNMRGCARRSTKGGGKGGTGKKERGEEGWPASQRRASSATTSSRRKVSRESAKGTNQGRGGFFWKDGGQKEEEEEGGFLSLKELFRQAEEAVLEAHTKDAAEVSCCALCSHSQ